MISTKDILASNAEMRLLPASDEVLFTVYYICPFNHRQIVASAILNSYTYESFVNTYALLLDRMFYEIYDRLD